MHFIGWPFRCSASPLQERARSSLRQLVAPLFTCIRLAESRKPVSYLTSAEGQAELEQLLGSSSSEEIACALPCAGLLWRIGTTRREWTLGSGYLFGLKSPLLTMVEGYLFETIIRSSCRWLRGLGVLWEMHCPSPVVLDRLLVLWHTNNNPVETSLLLLYLGTLGLPRHGMEACIDSHTSTASLTIRRRKSALRE